MCALVSLNVCVYIYTYVHKHCGVLAGCGKRPEDTCALRRRIRQKKAYTSKTRLGYFLTISLFGVCRLSFDYYPIPNNLENSVFRKIGYSLFDIIT